MKELDFAKMGGLIPAIVQDDLTGRVLMLGYMNREAYQKTLDTGLVTFSAGAVNSFGRRGRPRVTCFI